MDEDNEYYNAWYSETDQTNWAIRQQSSNLLRERN